MDLDTIFEVQDIIHKYLLNINILAMRKIDNTYYVYCVIDNAKSKDVLNCRKELRGYIDSITVADGISGIKSHYVQVVGNDCAMETVFNALNKAQISWQDIVVFREHVFKPLINKWK
jgi:tryptophanase